MKLTGKVAMFNGDRGFGFIRPDERGQPQIFVHVRNVVLPADRDGLDIGDEVEFDLGKNRRNGEAEAMNVCIVGCAP